MSEFFRKLGVSYSEIDNRYSPLMTNLSGPEAVWAMFHMSGWAVGYTGVNMLARASYSITAPIQVDENNPKLFKVTIRNLSDRRFKVGSESTIEYFKHDLDVLSPMRLVGIHKTLPELIAKINSTAKVQLSLSDFDVENCINDDGMWHLVASEESYFFVKDSFVKFNDRTSWPKIVDWLPNWNLDVLVKVNPSENETDWDRTILEENLIRINRVASPNNKIDVKRLTLHTPVKSGDRTEIVMDRVGKDTLIGPAEYKYDRLPIKLAMARPVAIDIPWEKMQVNTNDDTLLFKTSSKKEVWFREVFKVTQGGDVGNSITGSTIHLKASESNDARGKLEIGLSGKTKISFNFSANSNGPSAEFMSIFIGETGQYNFPLRSGTCTIEEMGRFIRLHMDSTKWDIPANGITKITISSTQPLGARRYCNVYITNLTITEELVDDVAPEFVEGTIYGQLDLINDHYGTKFTEDDIEDGIIEAELEKSVTLVAKPGRYSFEEGSEYRIVRARDMSTVFQNKDLSGFAGFEHKGPGNQHSKVGYEYPDGRHTRYLGRVPDTELFTPQEVADTFVAPTGANITVHYPTTEWFKYELDGDIVYIPMKPLFGGLSYNQLKTSNVVNRSGDHLAKVPANAKGNYKAGVHPFYRNKVITKDGRAYAVRMIKGANIDGPLPFTTGLSDDASTHDSEWNRMMYNLTETTILPINVGDSHASQRGPKWDSNSAANMVVENNGANLRYTYCPELTIEGNVPKGIYRGCYGVSIRGRQGNGIDALETVMGFRPMLKLLPKLQTKTKLVINDMAGFKVVDFHLDTDLDYCHNVEVMVQYPGKDYFTKIPYSIAIDGIYLLLEEKHIGCKFKFRHTDTLHTYESEVLDITEDLVGDSLDYSMNGPGPKVPKRIRNSDEVEDLQIMYFGRVTTEEFMTSGELRESAGLTVGTEMDCVGWFKFAYDGEICYVPEKPITHSINMLQLKDAGLRSGKVFNKDGQEYSTRVLRGTRYHEMVKFDTLAVQGLTTTHRQDYAMGSEWNELYYRLSDVTTTDDAYARTNDTYLVRPESQFEHLSYDELLMVDNTLDGTFSTVYELNGAAPETNSMYRGVYGMSRFSHYGGGLTGTGNRLMGFRPIVYLGRGALKTTSSTELFRGMSSIWTQLANNLRHGNRHLHNSYLYGSNIGLVFGDNSPAEQNNQDILNYTGGVGTKANPTRFRYGGTFTKVGDLFYLIGGRSSLTNATFERSIQVYNPVLDTYRDVGTFPINISFHTATAVNGLIWIVGGHDEKIPASSHSASPEFSKKFLYSYDTVTGEIKDYSTLSSLKTRYSAQAQLHNGKIYFFGGRPFVDSTMEYLDLKTMEYGTIPNPLAGLDYGFFMNRMENHSGPFMYILFGWSTLRNTYGNQAYQIDLRDMTYVKLADAPVSKTGISPVMFRGKVFVPGGWNGTGKTNIPVLGQEYDLTEAGRVDDKYNYFP